MNIPQINIPQVANLIITIEKITNILNNLPPSENDILECVKNLSIINAQLCHIMTLGLDNILKANDVNDQSARLILKYLETVGKSKDHCLGQHALEPYSEYPAAQVILKCKKCGFKDT